MVHTLGFILRANQVFEVELGTDIGNIFGYMGLRIALGATFGLVFGPSIRKKTAEKIN
jgi:hypothetical protein